MRRIVSAVALGLALASAVFAQKQNAKTEIAFSGFTWKPGETVEIDADKMSLSLNERRATFEGKVVVRKAASQIHCDRLTVNYLQSGQVSQLLASGAVKLSEGKSLAAGDELEYLKDANKIWLRGNPELVDGGQTVQGEEMEFDLSRSLLVVTSPRIQFEKVKNE